MADKSKNAKGEKTVDGRDPFAAFGLAADDDAPLWVFGYGSLMWNPGFDYARSMHGHLCGYHRRFCLLSVHYRGVPEQPGLVLGLDRGGSCHGVLFEVAPDKKRDALRYLWQREMTPPGIYLPRRLPVTAGRGIDGRVAACTFVVNRAHEHYHAQGDSDLAAAIISKARGANGRNADYLANTVEHLQSLGIRDRQLEGLLQKVRQHETKTA